MSTPKIENIDLQDLSITSDELAAILQPQFPLLASRPGTPYRELILNPGAAVISLAQSTVDTAVAATTLFDISESATVDETMADSLLANWKVARGEGSKAYGYLKLTTNVNRSYFLAAGTKFTTSDGLNFYTQTAITAKYSGDLETNEVRLYQDISDSSLYFFSIPVIAESPGLSYKLSAGATVLFPNAFIELQGIDVVTTFSGGDSAETVSQAVARIPEAIADASIANALSISRFIKNNFSTITKVATIGAGDPEMLRDQDNICGISIGGKADIYIRGDYSPEIKTFTVNALKGAAANTWLFSILPDNAAAASKIRSISPANGKDPVALTFSAIRQLASSTGRHAVQDLITCGFSAYGKMLVTVSDYSVVPSRAAYVTDPVRTSANATDILTVVTGTYAGDETQNITDRDILMEVTNAGAPGAARVRLKDYSTGNVLTSDLLVSGAWSSAVSVAADDVFDGLVISFTSASSSNFAVGDTWRIRFGASYYQMVVDVYCQDQVRAIQTLLDSSENRPVMADYLVKSFCPCFVTIAATVEMSSTSVLDETALKQALATYINQLETGRDLTHSNLDAVFHKYSVLSVSELTLIGSLVGPDGTTYALTGADLVLPNTPSSGLTPNTINFVCDVDSISISL